MLEQIGDCEKVDSKKLCNSSNVNKECRHAPTHAHPRLRSVSRCYGLVREKQAQ